MRRLRLAAVMIAAAAAAGVAACGSDMPAAGTSETTAIHIEVLRHFLTSLREGTGPVFIMERIDAAAADPTLHSAGTDLIPAAERDAITTALQDIVGVRFIAAMEETWVDQDSCPLVPDGGTVITIGPVTPAKGSYHVAMKAFRTCTGARWLTYAVVRSGDAWKVTGTVGPESIAERCRPASAERIATALAILRRRCSISAGQAGRDSIMYFEYTLGRVEPKKHDPDGG